MEVVEEEEEEEEEEDPSNLDGTYRPKTYTTYGRCVEARKKTKKNHIYISYRELGNTVLSEITRSISYLRSYCERACTPNSCNMQQEVVDEESLLEKI